MGRVEGQVLLLRGGLKLQFQFLSRPLMWSGSTHSPNRNLTLPPYPTFSMLSFLFLAFHKERALFFHHFFYLSISLSLSPSLSLSLSLWKASLQAFQLSASSVITCGSIWFLLSLSLSPPSHQHTPNGSILYTRFCIQFAHVSCSLRLFLLKPLKNKPSQQLPHHLYLCRLSIVSARWVLVKDLQRYYFGCFCSSSSLLVTAMAQEALKFSNWSPGLTIQATS